MLAEMDQVAEFRAVLGGFPTGVAVVSGLSDGVPVGLTVQSFMSLSLDPPMILLAVDRKSTSWPLIAAAGRFAVNVLAQGQEDVALKFARSGTDKFAQIRWAAGPKTGSPLIDGCQFWIEAEAGKSYDGGDHMIVTAHVLSLRTGDDRSQPLVFFRSRFRQLDQPSPVAG